MPTCEQKRQSKLTRKKIIALMKKGLYTTEIAKIVGISQQMVSWHKRKIKVEEKFDPTAGGNRITFNNPSYLGPAKKK